MTTTVSRLMLDYAEVRVEITNDYGLVDFVEQRYDAGIRLGEQVARAMIGFRIDPDFRQAVVRSPSYFERRTTPVTPHDLTVHIGINLRLPISGGLWFWPFAKKSLVRTNAKDWSGRMQTDG
ncbi:hypothetical protein [Pseudomonas sp. ANT_J12]|uniref:hypothetical protein n=1 Tax=Pseudomonas sp. ANT_J12 TaxID=2597351 RepID=UPI00355671A0